MVVTEGMALLELKGPGLMIYPTVLWDEKTAVLVDTGVAETKDQLLAALEEVGVPFKRIEHIILTHQDADHIGGLPELLLEADHPITVYAHELDKPYIEGDRHLIKADPDQLSREELEALPAPLRAVFENPPRAAVNRTLENQDVLPFFGGIHVISTPGHTPGHISLYVEKTKTLIAGDALVTAGGVLHGPVAKHTPDMETALISVKKFTKYDIEKVVCYHGGLYPIQDQVEDFNRILNG